MYVQSNKGFRRKLSGLQNSPRQELPEDLLFDVGANIVVPQKSRENRPGVGVLLLQLLFSRSVPAVILFAVSHAVNVAAVADVVADVVAYYTTT